MANDKSPRLDDFPYEFYKILWDFLDLDLLHIYQEAIKIGSLGSITIKGNIRFIPKVGDPELITNQRLITLLNISYKIIYKTITLNLHTLLSMIIQLEQIGFIHGWYILDNVLVLWECMEWAYHSQQDILFLKINFEKAYDKIEWSLILYMLYAIGFGPNFIQTIIILFSKALAMLSLNNI